LSRRPGLPQRTGCKANNHAKRDHDGERPIHSDPPTISEHIPIEWIAICLLLLRWRMFSSENRYPFFRNMRYRFSRTTRKPRSKCR
jgi:hypothetical protein